VSGGSVNRGKKEGRLKKEEGRLTFDKTTWVFHEEFNSLAICYDKAQLFVPLIA